MRRVSGFIYGLCFLVMCACSGNDNPSIQPTLSEPAPHENTFCVTPCPGTELVRVQTSTGFGMLWETQATITEPEPDGRFCWTADMAQLNPDQPLTFIVFSAVNTHGESTTEHGLYYGEGYQPEVSCF